MSAPGTCEWGGQAMVDGIQLEATQLRWCGSWCHHGLKPVLPVPAGRRPPQPEVDCVTTFFIALPLQAERSIRSKLEEQGVLREGVHDGPVQLKLEVVAA